MSTALKDRYNLDFFQSFAIALKEVTPLVDTSGFIANIFTDQFKEYELKQRMYHVTTVLNGMLSKDFHIACNQIVQITEELKLQGVGENFEYMFLPDYVATYGLDDFDMSMDTLAKTTSFTSAEFAVRPFIIKYPKEAMAKMLVWSSNDESKIRRLASEGSRPRLPWAMALPQLKSDPSPAIPILEKLKTDSDEVVRRSVANHLNDICKDNPEVAKSLATKWYGRSDVMDALIKHGVRTLLKQGDSEIMTLFGLDAHGLDIDHFTVATPEIRMGERLRFSFDIKNEQKSPRTVRIEFAIYLLKKNGSHSKKVFKISERSIPKNKVSISKDHHFKPITTRVYHPGKHFISVILNGTEFARLPFELDV